MVFLRVFVVSLVCLSCGYMRFAWFRVYDLFDSSLIREPGWTGFILQQDYVYSCGWEARGYVASGVAVIGEHLYRKRNPTRDWTNRKSVS